MSILGENIASHIQVIWRNISDRVSKEVDSVVGAVKNWVQGHVLITIDSVAITRVEKAVRTITGCLERGPNSKVQNPDQTDFLGSMGDTAYGGI